jgi:predicted nucleotidyltransferase
MRIQIQQADAMDTASKNYIQNVARELFASFKDPSNLLGVYLHGSAVLGGYDVKISDIDILAVCKQPMAIAEKDAVTTRLTRTNLPCPAEGLELSIVTLDTVRNPLQESPYELHITTFPDDAKVLNGKQTAGWKGGLAQSLMR